MKSLLITGGTGSFGQAFVREALKHDVHAIRVYSRNEYLQWRMKEQPEFQDERIRWMLGDVRDRDRLSSCLRNVNSVIHAAALKHVSFGEYNPQEFIKTNIDGSSNIVDCCVAAGVHRVLGISSDKAVAPNCLYGSTKQVMETLFLDANRRAMPLTRFSILRPGNYRESNGNVFERWPQQATTGQIELTDVRMMRYFIPVQQCAKIAWKVLCQMQGCEVFVPRMDEQAMYELASQSYPDCQIKLTGKGPGEKLREGLFMPDEEPIDCGDYWTVRK